MDDPADFFGRRERRLDPTEREPDWDAWNRRCDARIQSALADQQKFLLTVVGEALGKHVAKERKAMKRELAEEVRLLRIELAEAQTTISELRSVLAAERNAPIDLPALPTRRGLN
jgi:hypothetical protein